MNHYITITTPVDDYAESKREVIIDPEVTERFVRYIVEKVEATGQNCEEWLYAFAPHAVYEHGFLCIVTEPILQIIIEPLLRGKQDLIGHSSRFEHFDGGTEKHQP